MRKLVYSMMVSLDGFIEAPPQHSPNPLDWVIIDQEIHEFANQEARESGVFLYGRRLYENMAAFWPTSPPFSAKSSIVRMMRWPLWTFFSIGFWKSPWTTSAPL